MSMWGEHGRWSLARLTLRPVPGHRSSVQACGQPNVPDTGVAPLAIVFLSDRLISEAFFFFAKGH